jgi:hypothetical protein
MGLGFKPYKQPPRRMILDIINRVKEKKKMAFRWWVHWANSGFSKKYEYNKNSNLKYV